MFRPETKLTLTFRPAASASTAQTARPVDCDGACFVASWSTPVNDANHSNGTFIVPPVRIDKARECLFLGGSMSMRVAERCKQMSDQPGSKNKKIALILFVLAIIAVFALGEAIGAPVIHG